MTTTAQLKADPHAQWELAFLVDGIRPGFVSHAALESLDSGDGRVYRRGLVRDGLVRRMAIDDRTGALEPNIARIRIEDGVGDLAALFATDHPSVEPLEQNIGPSDDLTALTQFHDKWIGHEKIGAAGERHEYPVPLGFSVGLSHYTLADGADDSYNPMHPPPVSDEPVLWKGRRWVLYRIYRDHIEEPTDYSAGWRPSSEWERVWWGNLEDDGKVEGRVWTLRCSSVDSWPRKDLGQLYQTKESAVDFELSYTKNTDFPLAEVASHEAGIAIRILTTNEGANGGQGGGINGFYGDVQWDQRYQFSGDTIEELREELGAAVVNLNNEPGDDGTWSDLSGCSLIYSASDRTITLQCGEDVAQEIVGIVAMHKSMWGRLGFDVGVEQNDGTYSNGYERWEASDRHDEPPGDGYVFFRMKARHGELLGETNEKPPLQVKLEPDFGGGVVSLDPEAVSARGQVMLVERLGGTSVAHFGQLRAPVASDPADAGAAWPLGGPAIDRSGTWLLSGKRRFANSDEEVDTYQVVEASWGDADGLVRSGRVVCTKLLNPFNFGYGNKKLSAAWNAQPGQIKARPLICLGYRQGSEFDEAHIVMQRLLLSTGTSEGWSSFSNDNPSLDPGDNESTHSGTVVRDGEYADLGLAIPEEMVQHASLWHEQAQEVGDAIRCKAAITPGQNAEDVLHGIMRPLGWAWSLRNGKYGIWTPFAPIEEENIDVAITRSNIDRRRLESMVLPSQDIREFAPIDRFKVSCSWAPYVEDYLFTRQRNSFDRGRRYRPGGIEEGIDAPAWRGQGGGFDTEPIFSRLQSKAQFWERRHFVVKRLPVLPTLGRQLWPGTYTRFTHELPVDPMAGTYGVAGRRGVVLALEEHMSRSRPGFFIDLLIHADRSVTPKLHAFSARGIGYDSDNDRILVADNWLALAGDGTRSDAAFFVEPSYVGLEPFGGNARIQWAQWDGTAWAFTGTGVVTDVDTTPGAAYIEITPSTGTYYACMDTVVMPVAVTEQDADWVLQLYAGIGDQDGEYTAGVRTSVWEDLP